MEASERDYSADQNHMDFMVGTPWEGMTAFDDRSTSSAWGVFQAVNGRQVKQNGRNITNSSGSFHIEPIANGCVTALNDDVCIQTGAQSTAIDRPLRFNANSQRYLMGGLDRNNLFGTLEHDIDDNFVAFGELNYYQSRYEGMREQAASLAAAPIIVPAPGLLSMMTEAPVCCDTLAASMRASESDPDPAGNGTTMRIGLPAAGHASGCGDGAATAAVQASMLSAAAQPARWKIGLRFMLSPPARLACRGAAQRSVSCFPGFLQRFHRPVVKLF